MARVKKEKSVDLRIEDFQYLSDAELPRVILGMEINKSAFEANSLFMLKNFKPCRQFHKLAHDTAGIAHRPKYFIATLLDIKPEYLKPISDLTTKWYGSNLGAIYTTLHQVISYNKDIQEKLKATCNYSWKSLSEGLYPLDLGCMREMANDDFPKDLDDWIEFKHGFERAAGALTRWELIILGKNSKNNL